MRKLVAIARRFRERQTGASLVEYGLLVALIAVIAVSAVAFFGGAVPSLFNVPAPF